MLFSGVGVAALNSHALLHHPMLAATTAVLWFAVCFITLVKGLRVIAEIGT